MWHTTELPDDDDGGGDGGGDGDGDGGGDGGGDGDDYDEPVVGMVVNVLVVFGGDDGAASLT